MKTFVLAAAAAATLAASLGGAAQAQNRFQPNYGNDLGQRLSQLDNRIDRGLSRGDLTRREAQALRRDLRATVQLERRYGYDGFSRWERQDLSRRVDQLAARVRYERRDSEDRGDRRGDRWDDGRDHDRGNGRPGAGRP